MEELFVMLEGEVQQEVPHWISVGLHDAVCDEKDRIIAALSKSHDDHLAMAETEFASGQHPELWLNAEQIIAKAKEQE